MFIKIIFKNYKKNLGKYIIYSLCNVLTVSMIYLFWSIMAVFTNAILNDRAAYLLFYDIQWDFLVSGVIITFVSIFMTFIAFKNYIWLRIQDYNMYMILGMRRRRFLIMLSLEYLVNWTVSFVMGMLSGVLLFRGAINIIDYFMGISFSMQDIGLNVILKTLFVSAIVALAVFLGIMTWLEGKDVGDIKERIHANEKRPGSKWWSLGFIVSGVCVLISVWLYLQGEWSWFYSHFLWILAGIIFLITGLGLALMWIKKKDSYYRQLIWLNGLYSKYINSIVMISVLFSIHFFVLGYAANWIASCFPIGERADQYNYDYVWMAKTEQEAAVKEIVNKYEGDWEELPMIRVYDFSEQIGISQDDYEKLTGEKIELKNQEILFSVPNRKSGGRKEVLSNIEYLHLYPGKYTNDRFLEARRQNVSGNFPRENTFLLNIRFRKMYWGIIRSLYCRIPGRVQPCRKI